MTAIELKARILSQEIESTIVHRIAADQHVPPHIAALYRRFFLLEEIVGEPLCVEVSGSAHHTPTGERGEPDLEEPAPEVEVDVEEDDGDEVEGTTKEYTFMNVGVVSGVQAGLVVPVGDPFKRARSSDRIHRYVRLTATGKHLAKQYIRMEAAAKAKKPCLAGTPFEAQVRSDWRAGRLSLGNTESHR